MSPAISDHRPLSALSQVLSALASGQIDPRRAALLLYGLQIASQNVNRNGFILPLSTGVTSVEISEDGNELGSVRKEQPTPALRSPSAPQSLSPSVP